MIYFLCGNQKYLSTVTLYHTWFPESWFHDSPSGCMIDVFFPHWGSSCHFSDDDDVIGIAYIKDNGAGLFCHPHLDDV